MLESKIGSCCVTDTLGSVTGLYQVIQEYLIFSVGQGLKEIVSLVRSLDTLGEAGKHWHATFPSLCLGVSRDCYRCTNLLPLIPLNLIFV